MSDLISPLVWATHSTDRFDSAKLLSLKCFSRTCLQTKAWTVDESQRFSECYQRQLARCWHQTARIRKVILQLKII